MSDFQIDKNLHIGTVFEVSGSSMKVTLSRKLSELVQTHNGTVYQIGQIGSIIKVFLGPTILFAMVRLLRLQTEEEAAALGESTGLDRRLLEADLIGEGQYRLSDDNFKFVRGVKNFPLPLQEVFLVTNNEATKLYTAIESAGDNEKKKYISFGSYSNSTELPCQVNMDKLFGHHFAVLGSTGTGKSTAVAGIIRSVTEQSDPKTQQKYPRIIIVDPHGEYQSAFTDIACVFTAYNDESATSKDTTLIKLPYWLMSSEEFQRLVSGKGEFEATSQANVIYKALTHARMVNAGLVVPAACSTRLSDKEVHPDLPKAAKGVNPEQITQFNRDWPIPFDLDEFLNHIKICQNRRLVRDKWEELAASDYHRLFSSVIDKLSTLRNDKRISFLMKNFDKSDGGLADILAQFVGKNSKSGDKPIRIIDISGLPTEVAGPLTGAMSRLLFNYKLSQTRDDREKDPILIVCEEAHRYVPEKGEAQYSVTQAAIRRIAREGRKYGIGLMLVSQRPSDLESTVLSQCSTWLVLRLTNGTDQEHVGKFLPDTMSNLTRLLPSLPRQEALFVGEAAPLPSRIKLNVVSENNQPSSSDVSFAKGWENSLPEIGELSGITEKMSGK